MRSVDDRLGATRPSLPWFRARFACAREQGAALGVRRRDRNCLAGLTDRLLRGLNSRQRRTWPWARMMGGACCATLDATKRKSVQKFCAGSSSTGPMALARQHRHWTNFRCPPKPNAANHGGEGGEARFGDWVTWHSIPSASLAPDLLAARLAASGSRSGWRLRASLEQKARAMVGAPDAELAAGDTRQPGGPEPYHWTCPAWPGFQRPVFYYRHMFEFVIACDIRDRPRAYAGSPAKAF